jgi:hypothetical protein
MNPVYPLVARRADHRCEYCGAPEAVFNFPFEVEHVVPRGRGGGDDESNLALACRSCNVFKGDALEALDPLENRSVRLFHPRQDTWSEHFATDESGRIIGKTAVGRAAVSRLRMNSPVQIEARKRWMELKIFPPA